MSNFFRCHWPLLAFLLAALVATIFSVDYQQSLRVQSTLLSALFCYVAIVVFSDSPHRLRYILLALSFSVFVLALCILPEAIQSSLENPLVQVKLYRSIFFVAPNDVIVLSVIAPLMLGAIWTSSWWLRGLTAACLILALIIGVNLQSRQAVFLLLLGQFIVVTLMRPRWALPALLIGVIVGVAIDGLSGWTLSHKIFLFPRTYVWHAAWMMFLDRPWTGQGPGLFRDIYFMFLGKAGYVLETLPDRRPMSWAHSLYLEQLAERGIIGFFALLGLLGASIYRAAQCWRNTIDSDLMRGLAAGVLASLIVLSIAGIAEATLLRLWVAIALLVLAASSVAMFSMVDFTKPIFEEK